MRSFGKVGLELKFGERIRRRWRRKRTCWPFEWPCWMEREGEWRSAVVVTMGVIAPPPANLRVWRASITNPKCTLFQCSPSRHSFLFSAIPSPFHFPKHGRHASSATVTEFFSAGYSTTPGQSFHSTLWSIFTGRMSSLLQEACSAVALFCWRSFSSNTPIVSTL